MTSTDLQDALAQIKARAEEAEPYAEQMDAGYPPHSESMVLQSQADVPRLLEAVEAVMEVVEQYPGEAGDVVEQFGDAILAALTDKL